MLYALQQELVSSTMVEMVSIRQREIDLLSKQARGLAFLFAVIAGVLADSMWTGYYMYYIRLVSSSTLQRHSGHLLLARKPRTLPTQPKLQRDRLLQHAASTRWRSILNRH